MRESPSKLECDLGLKYLLTETPGIGGRLKTVAEDFQVSEVPIKLSTVPIDDALYTILDIRLWNWDTRRFVNALARALNIPRSQITFAGTKDKRAVSRQYFCIKVVINEEKCGTLVGLKGVECLAMHYTRRPLYLGDLVGNSFEITVRDIDPGDETMARVKAIKAEVEGYGGFLNYYGLQRFGTSRPITHLVGRALVKGDYRACVMSMIRGENSDKSSDDMATAVDHEDWDEALELMSGSLDYERKVIKAMAEGHTYLDALKRLSRETRTLFIHAYQSYLFNLTLSERIRRGLEPFMPVEGDVVMATDRFGLPSPSRYETLTPTNMRMLEDMCRRGRAFVATPVLGYETMDMRGEIGDIIGAILDAEGISNRDFLVPEMPDLRPKGTLRANRAPFKALRIESVHEVGDNAVVGSGENTKGLRFSFQLNKGTYATCLMREFMKAEEARSYS